MGTSDGDKLVPQEKASKGAYKVNTVLMFIPF